MHRVNLEDLGINPKTGVHNRTLTPVESRFLGILWDTHVGSDNTISARALAYCFERARTGQEFPADPEEREARGKAFLKFSREVCEEIKRAVRDLQNHLLMHHDNIPILSKSGGGGGYFIAANDAEAEQFYESFRQRGITGFRKASRGKAAALADAVVQMTFDFENDFQELEYTGMVERRASMPAPVEVVDAFLEKMSRNPEKFADGLRKIGRKYGSVLLPRQQAAELKNLVSQMQQKIGEIGI